MTFRSLKIHSILLLVIGLLLASSDDVRAQNTAPPIGQKNMYIKSIFFGGGSYYIDDVQNQELIDFILDIPDLKEYEIVIHGHTDNIGSVEFNQWLSQMRAAGVLDIIAELELDKAGIQVHDFGEESPYYDNRTWDGKLSNRRVDVIIQKITM